MPLQTFTNSTPGRWCFTAVACFIPFSPPFVILAYKWRHGAPLQQWIWWFGGDLLCLFLAFGSLSQMWARLQGLSIHDIGLQIGLPTSIMYFACIALALYVIWQYKFPNTASNAGGGGGGGGGMGNSQQSYNDKDGGFSLNKSSRRRAIVERDSSEDEEEETCGSSHLENVADARAAAAEQTRKAALRGY